MAGTRESFLQRVRQAVADGNRAGHALPLEPRGNVGYQGAGSDPVRCFCEQFTAAGGSASVLRGDDAVRNKVMELIEARRAQHVLLEDGAILSRIALGPLLERRGLKTTHVANLPPANGREAFFAADISVTGVAYLIAETGSVAVASRADSPRSTSLLAPVHIAIAERRQIIPDLFDLFASAPESQEPPDFPSCLTLITGPSKTGDIELRLVTGVHGPGEIHVIVMD
jgi:L-lactate dehydrogenase complex protein LldG